MMLVRILLVTVCVAVLLSILAVKTAPADPQPRLDCYRIAGMQHPERGNPLALVFDACAGLFDWVEVPSLPGPKQGV